MQLPLCSSFCFHIVFFVKRISRRLQGHNHKYWVPSFGEWVSLFCEEVWHKGSVIVRPVFLMPSPQQDVCVSHLEQEKTKKNVTHQNNDDKNKAQGIKCEPLWLLCRLCMIRSYCRVCTNNSTVAEGSVRQPLLILQTKTGSKFERAMYSVRV